MDEQKHIINESTLAAYFNGKLPLPEQKEVEAWIGQSEENRKIARDVRFICQAADTLDSIRQVDSQAALKKTKAKIRKRNNVSWLIRLQQVAAILAIPLLMATLYLTLKEEPTEYVEVQTNPGMIAKLELPDGTKVWLNSSSSLRHPVRFTGSNRDVELKGEAYFAVHPDQYKPFIVNTPFNIRAEVLGTEFNMEAYETEREVKTTLVSGSVKLTFQTDKDEEKSYILKPDEEFIYNYQNKKLSVQKPYIPTLTAWKDGLVIFRNTPFEEALKVLGKRFNVEFVIKNDKLYENAFTGPFDGQHLQLILEHFRLSSGIQYRFIDPKTGTGEKVEEKSIVELY